MAMNKNLSSIVIEDLQALIDNEVSESKTIEFKETLPSNSRDDKKEFLADVSSFANAGGGLLIYGIKEEQGIAVELSGLRNINVDSEILRLENLLRDSIEPRVPSIQISSVPLQSGGNILIIQVPRSWAQPHVVNFSGHWRFYSRNSAGKYALDVSELRSAFNLSGAIAERIRLFRTERLGKIFAGETPLMLAGGAKVVLHVVPLNSLDTAAEVFDVSKFADEQYLYAPISANGWNNRYNFDGYLTYAEKSDDMNASTYLQIFRNGIIEAVDERLLRPRIGNGRSIPSVAFEDTLLKSLLRYLEIQKRLGIPTPLFVMLSIIGVSGYVMNARGPRHRFLVEDEGHPIDRDVLVIPEIMIDDFNCDPFETMRPAFDAVWNAAGWPRSMNYDREGKWIGQ